MANQEYDHEFDRIEQFRREANGDRIAFEKKILLRSSKTSEQKRERFAAALRACKENELAQRVLMVGAMKQMAE
jgi:hypothetical protein